MDYDWLWVILAVGVLAPVGFVPVALARNACARGANTAAGGVTARREA
jgi:hypothetical protein